MLRLFSKWPVFIRELTFFQGEIQIANKHMKRCSAALVMKVKVAQSCRLFATPWTLQSMEFSRPEYWNG